MAVIMQVRKRFFTAMSCIVLLTLAVAHASLDYVGPFPRHGFTPNTTNTPPTSTAGAGMQMDEMYAAFASTSFIILLAFASEKDAAFTIVKRMLLVCAGLEVNPGPVSSHRDQFDGGQTKLCREASLHTALEQATTTLLRQAVQTDQYSRPGTSPPLVPHSTREAVVRVVKHLVHCLCIPRPSCMTVEQEPDCSDIPTTVSHVTLSRQEEGVRRQDVAPTTETTVGDTAPTMLATMCTAATSVQTSTVMSDVKAIPASQYLLNHPSIVGMTNNGNKCFVPAILNILASTKQFSDAIQPTNRQCFHKDTRLVPLLYDILVGLVGTEDAATRLCNLVTEYNKGGDQFNDGQQKDAHEFLLALLDMMHSECLPESTLFSELFGIRLTNRWSCNSAQCNLVDVCIEEDVELILSLAANPGTSTLVDAYSEYMAPEERDRLCACGAQRSLVVKELSSLPDLIPVHFKRYNSDLTKNNKPIVPLSTWHPDGDTEYVLTGIAVHQGKSMSLGHYIAAITGPTGTLTIIDDDKISTVQDNNTVDAYRNQGYILMYTKTGGSASSRLLEGKGDDKGQENNTLSPTESTGKGSANRLAADTQVDKPKPNGAPDPSSQHQTRSCGAGWKQEHSDTQTDLRAAAYIKGPLTQKKRNKKPNGNRRGPKATLADAGNPEEHANKREQKCPSQVGVTFAQRKTEKGADRKWVKGGRSSGTVSGMRPPQKVKFHFLTHTITDHMCCRPSTRRQRQSLPPPPRYLSLPPGSLPPSHALGKLV